MYEHKSLSPPCFRRFVMCALILVATVNGQMTLAKHQKMIDLIAEKFRYPLALSHIAFTLLSRSLHDESLAL